MSEVVVLYCDEVADPIAANAIGHLGGLVQDGIVKPFWQVHVHHEGSRSARATSWRQNEATDVDLLRALSGIQGITRVRLVTIATSALPSSALASLQNSAEGLAAVFAETQPAGVPFVDVRLIAPTDLEEPTHLTGLFSADAAANIVAYPEDRASDAAFALPVSAAATTTFELHVAVETATQVGLWHNMASAPVDTAAPGLISGDIRVWLSRSFARIAVAPPLPVERAIGVSEVLPVPSGTEPAPVPRQTAAEYAEQLVNKVDELHFHKPQAPPSGREAGIRATAELLWAEAKTYLRGLPYQLRHGAAADLSLAAGEALTATLGSSAVVEVVWEGKVPDGDEKLPPPVDVDELRQRLLERLKRPESPSFDQNIWSSLVDDIFAMVDGGATSEGTTPPTVGAERVAVVDPQAVAPDPTEGLEFAIEAISSESLGAERPTAVGQLSARIRSEIDRSDRYVDDLLATITVQLGQLRSHRNSMLSVLAWAAGILVAATLGVIAVFSGFAESIGVDSWSYDDRFKVLVTSSVVLQVLLAGLLIVGLRGQPRLPVAFVIAGFIALVGLVISLFLWEAPEYSLGFIGTVRIGELTYALTIGAVFIVVLVCCALEHTQRGRVAARFTGVLAIGFLMVAAVTAVVRPPTSWYSTVAEANQLGSYGIRWTAILGCVLLVVLISTMVLRVRERLTVDRLRQNLTWASASAELAVVERTRLAQALRQWHGSAAALARTVWSPFGKLIEDDEAPAPNAAVDGEIRKMQLFVLEPREEDLLGVMSRIGQEIADPGWLRRQYQVAVDAFQPRYAVQTGRAVGLGSIRRPEADPAPEDPSLGAESPGSGIRWVFADMLLGGKFDDELRVAGTKLALESVLEMYLARGHVGEDKNADIASFGEALVDGEAQNLPVHLFAKAGFPVAGDARAQFSTQIWWPRGISRPQTRRLAQIHETTVSANSSSRLVIPFLRSDWSPAMPLKQLPFYLSAKDSRNRGLDEDKWREDDTSDDM